MTENASSTPTRVPFYRDIRVLHVLWQIAFVVVVLLVGWFMFNNVARGLARIGGGFGFGFLEGAASFALSETPLPYTPATDPYLYVFALGIINTLRVVVVGIVLTTIVGLFVGIALISPNWLLAKIAQVYVELFRNTPLLIQLFFWYFVGILKLPRARDSVQLPGSFFLSNRGFVMPWVIPTETVSQWLVVLLIDTGVAILLSIWLARARLPILREWRGIWALLVWLSIAFIAASSLSPFKPNVPALRGFNFQGGVTLSPEYVALLVGLVLYTGAFVAEIVRAGILAVPRGVTEASRAVGLTYVQTLRLVTIPLALRVIIPPLTNQYLNLSKNSSLAIAVGYADLFYVSNTIFNQTGQTLQVVFMIMTAYLVISLVIAAIMNGVNSRFRLVER